MNASAARMYPIDPDNCALAMVVLRQIFIVRSHQTYAMRGAVKRRLQKCASLLNLVLADPGPVTRVLSCREAFRRPLMSRALIVIIFLSMATSSQLLAQGKGIRLWNLTTATITG